MWVLYSFLLLFGQVYTETINRFTNVKCVALDPSYCSYKECEVRLFGRASFALNVHALLLKGPFKNGKVNFSFFRKYKEYRPFMFNNTYDFCKFMAKKSSVLSVPKFVIDILDGASNINHSCPFEKEIIIRNLVFKEDHFKYLPLPTGEYQLQVMAATNGQWKTRVEVYFYRQEDVSKS